MARLSSHCLILALAILAIGPMRSVAPTAYEAPTVQAIVDAGRDEPVPGERSALVAVQADEDERGDEASPLVDAWLPAETNEVREGAFVAKRLSDEELPQVHLARRAHTDKARGPPAA